MSLFVTLCVCATCSTKFMPTLKAVFELWFESGPVSGLHIAVGVEADIGVGVDVGVDVGAGVTV